MNAVGQTAGSLSQSREAVSASREVSTFAQEAVREYKESPEQPKTLAGRIVHFLSESLRKLKDEGVMEMFSYWIEELSDALNFKERLGRLVQLTRESFLGRLFGLAEDLEQGLDKIHGKSVSEILQLAFGGLLSAGAITALAGGLKDKVGLDELLRAKDAPGGLGAFLLAKVQAGMEIPKAVWDQIRGPLGLPAWESIQARVKESMEGLRTFEEQIGLKSLRTNLKAYLDQHFPTWSTHPSMAWVHDLDDPQKIATALGVDLKNPSTWMTALEVGAGGAALTGGYFLLRRLMGANSPWPGRITLNVALYTFLANKGMNDLVLQGLEAVRELETIVCDAIDERIKGFLNGYGLKPEDINLPFTKGNSFGLADGMQWAWDLAHENPEIALVAINAVSLHDWALLRLFKGFFEFAVEGTWKTGKWMLDHKGAVVPLLGAVAVSYIKRREVIEDFAALIYPNDFEKRESFLKRASNVLRVNLSEPETPTEKVMDPVYERLLKDPLEFLSSGELKMQLFNDMAEGKVQWKMDPGLKSLALGLVAHGNPIWYAINLELGVFETLLNEFYSTKDPGEEFNCWAVATLGLEGYVVARAAQGSYKGYVALFDNDVHGVGRFNRLLKTIVPFGTGANRHLWWSALRQVADSFPLIRATDLINAVRISRVTYYAHEFLDAVARGDRRAVSNKLTLIQGEVPPVERAKYHYLDDIEIHRSLRDIERISSELNTKVLGRESTGRLVEALKEEIQRVETQFSRLLNIGKYFREGNFRLAFREVMTGVGLTRSAEALSARTLLAGKTDDELRREISELQEELRRLDPEDLTRADKLKALRIRQAYLNPRNVELLRMDTARFNGVDHDRRGLRLKEMASEMEAVEKGVGARVTRELEAIIEEARRLGIDLKSPEIQAKIQHVDDTLVRPFWQQKKAYLKEINAQYKQLPRHFRTPHLMAQLRLAHENTFLTRMVKGVKGRGKVALVMLPLMFSLDLLLARNDAERELFDMFKDFGPQGAQLLLDILPLAGTYSSFHTAISGEELVTGRTVEGWERASTWLWGGVGLAADALTALTFIPSGSTSVAANGAARLALAAARGSKTAVRLQRAWPRITALAERLGGWEEMVRSVRRFMGNADAGRLAKSLRTVQFGGIAAATAITIGGVSANLIYGVEDTDEGIALEEDVAPEFFASARDDLDPSESIEESSAATASA